MHLENIRRGQFEGVRGETATNPARLLERCPIVGYVWLWKDEAQKWKSRTKKLPFPGIPFNHAHDFLRRHAPHKNLCLPDASETA